MIMYNNIKMPEFNPGEVWLVGAGPGDPRLLTIFACYALSKADVIVYDALVSDTILSLSSEKARLVYAGKRGGKPSHSQENISDLVIDLAKKKNRVLRLKGGDPFVFARGAEEAQALSKVNIPYRIIPGITVGIGGLAAANIPLTSRDTNSSILFMTGHNAESKDPSNINWNAVSKIPVIVMYMALKNLSIIRNKLVDEGRNLDEPVAVIQDASLPEQKVLETTLSKLVEDVNLYRIASPSIVVIGPVVNLRSILESSVIKDGK